MLAASYRRSKWTCRACRAGSVPVGKSALRSGSRPANDPDPWPLAISELSATAQRADSGTLHPKPRLRLRLYASLVAIDLGCVAAAMLAAGTLRAGSWQPAASIELLALLAPLYFAVAANAQSYGLEALQNPRRATERALKSMAVATALVVGILFALKTSTEVSRLVLATGVAVSLVLIATCRLAFGQWIGHRHGWRFTNEVLIVDGAPFRPRAGELVIIADSKAKAITQDPVVMDRLGRALRFADRVILAARPDRRAIWTNALRGSGVDIEVLAPEIDSLGPLALRSYGNNATLLVGSKPLGMLNSAKKRALDLALAGPALLLLAIPMALIAIAIRLDSPGPVFFRQPRVGQGNRIFEILKFRTMSSETSDSGGTRSATLDDDRVTRVGRFLRSTSLDELPQLLNVLGGNMSLVGPRPHALASRAEEALFWEIDGRYWERHGIKPGITGLAQVRGFRGATATRADLTNRVRCDLEYVVGWSLRRDAMILLRTLRVLVHANAY